MESTRKGYSVPVWDDILDRSEPLWRELKGGRLFLTGCTGFFGAWFLETAFRAEQRFGLGLDLVALSRNPEAFLDRHPRFRRYSRLSFLRGNIQSFTEVDGAFSHVIHGAATSAEETFRNAPASEKFETVVRGTTRALDFASRRNVGDFLFFSSGAVYGPSTLAGTRIKEDSLLVNSHLDPRSAWAIAKISAEHLCALYSQKNSLRVKIARVFSVCGPLLPLRLHYALGNFLLDGLEGRPIQVRGDGSPVRSYLHASDWVHWSLAILLRGQALRPYNVGSENGLRLAEVAARVASQFDPVPAVLTLGQPDEARVAAHSYVPCTERARSELGVQEMISFPDGLRQTVNFYREGGVNRVDF